MRIVLQVGRSPVAPTHRKTARYVCRHIDELLFVGGDAIPCSMDWRHDSTTEDRRRGYRKQKT